MSNSLNFIMYESPYIYFNSNPATDDLIKNFSILKNEFLNLALHCNLADSEKNLYTNPNFSFYNKTNQENTMYTGLFKSIQLYMKSTLLDSIEKNNGNWKHNEVERINFNFYNMAQFHFDYIEKWKHIIGAANYNISYPGSRLKHHFGLDSRYIRLHFCIIESKKCIFDIENWKYIWKEGELIGFDDYNVYHGTDHSITSTIPRVILMIDMKKSYLKEFAQKWPCRTKRPELSLLLKLTPLKGWNNAEI